MTYQWVRDSHWSTCRKAGHWVQRSSERLWASWDEAAAHAEQSAGNHWICLAHGSHPRQTHMCLQQTVSFVKFKPLLLNLAMFQWPLLGLLVLHFLLDVAEMHSKLSQIWHLMGWTVVLKKAAVTAKTLTNRWIKFVNEPIYTIY